MIPFSSQAIRDLSQKLLGQILPNINSTYLMSDAAMMAMLMNALADEAESGVANRLADIQEMAILLEEAKNAGIQLPDYQTSTEALTLTAVNQVHDLCTRALIDVHARVEDDPAQTELNTRIWQYLNRTLERHALQI